VRTAGAGSRSGAASVILLRPHRVQLRLCPGRAAAAVGRRRVVGLIGQAAGDHAEAAQALQRFVQYARMAAAQVVQDRRAGGLERGEDVDLVHAEVLAAHPLVVMRQLRAQMLGLADIERSAVSVAVAAHHDVDAAEGDVMRQGRRPDREAAVEAGFTALPVPVGHGDTLMTLKSSLHITMSSPRA
jgi:hypothetical protein